jgi:hypothetical protein
MKRETYYLNITPRQMQLLQEVIKSERQRGAAEHNSGPRGTLLKSLQKAVDRSVYFHNKHRNSTVQSIYTSQNR